MINCVIVDDEPVARSIIRNYCSHLPFLKVMGEFGNALESRDFLAANKTDLLFLDIHMPVLNGIGFFSTLKNPPLVIFTTAYQEYAVNAFDLAACDYLLKPFSLDRFIIAIDKAKDKLQQTQNLPVNDQSIPPDHLFLKADGKIYKISYPDFLFAEAQGNYTKIVALNSPVVLTKMPFSELISLLPAELFLRVHRSFLINKAMISHIDGNRLYVMQNEIPVGSSYRAAFLKAIGIM